LEKFYVLNEAKRVNFAQPSPNFVRTIMFELRSILYCLCHQHFSHIRSLLTIWENFLSLTRFTTLRTSELRLNYSFSCNIFSYIMIHVPALLVQLFINYSSLIKIFSYIRTKFELLLLIPEISSLLKTLQMTSENFI